MARMMACTRRNRISCNECGEEIDGWMQKTRWGSWDADTQNFERRPTEDTYCRSCWLEHFGRDAAAYYEPETADELWNILAASNGRLAADLKPILVGGRTWVRVVNDEPQSVTGSTRTLMEEDVIQFGVEKVDIDREWFESLIGDAIESDHPAMVLLKPESETPFDDYRTLPETQTTLSEADSED